MNLIVIAIGLVAVVVALIMLKRKSAGSPVIGRDIVEVMGHLAEALRHNTEVTRSNTGTVAMTATTTPTPEAIKRIVADAVARARAEERKLAGIAIVPAESTVAPVSGMAYIGPVPLASLTAADLAFVLSRPDVQWNLILGGEFLPYDGQLARFA